MKRVMAALLALMLLLPVLAQAEFNNTELERLEGCMVLMHPGTLDKLVCPLNQPFEGEMEDAWLEVSVDFAEKIELDMTLIRVAVGIEVFDNVYADAIAFTVGGKRYAFSAQADVFEYDGVYQEDYYICLTDASLDFLKALAQQKKDDPIPVEFISLDEVVTTGTVVIPGDDAAWIYDTFVNLGGKTQPLKEIDDMWPCTITKVK